MAAKKNKKDILDKISDEETHVILRNLTMDKKIAAQARKIAKRLLRTVDPEEIAEDVFSALDGLEVEDVWENSGCTRHGYIEPAEYADERFGETLEPFLDEMKRCQDLGMDVEAGRHCIGIIKGLYRFREDATTAFFDYVEDTPGYYAETAYEIWAKGRKKPEDKKKIKALMKECGFK